MKIVVSPRASRERRAAVEYLRVRNPGAARKFSQNYKAVLESLLVNPALGPVRGSNDRRAIPIRSFSYLVIYRIEEDEIFILSIFHTAQDPAKRPD